jgi:hypothetical protein
MKATSIELTPAEIQSGHNRIQWAEGLIEQLPSDHDGRNSWLLNYGRNAEADRIRAEHQQPRKPLGYEPRIVKSRTPQAAKGVVRGCPEIPPHQDSGGKRI